MTSATMYSMENPVFRSFLTYAGLVLGKMLIMSVLTARQRMSKQVYANEEDMAISGSKHSKISFACAEVERVRRAHLNDLENVVPFVLVGLLYVASGPSPWVALLHFRVFTVARFLHTVVYLFAVPQPSRALAFFVGFLVCISMVCQLVMAGSF